MSLDVMCVTPASSAGWGPVTDLAVLAARLFETTPRFIHPRRPYGKARKVLSLAPQRRSGDRSLLLIASHPGDLLAMARPDLMIGRYGHVGVWIFDSFWADRIPLFARRGASIDHVWITDAEFVERYERTVQRPVSWLPWGTDALAAARQAHDDQRSTDVLRLGRQPSAWDDDDANHRYLSAHGMTYSGRFPDAGDGEANQQRVRALLGDSKVVLASGNHASPALYTHPTAEYISGRFTDAVAAGTVIAGQRPRCAAADLLPDEAWAEMDVTTRPAGLPVITEAVEQYSPKRAARLRHHALAHLDWRHRLAAIAATMQVQAPLLDLEMSALTKEMTELAC